MDTNVKAKEDPASVTSPSSPLPSSRTPPSLSHKPSSHPGRGGGTGGGPAAAGNTHPSGNARQATGAAGVPPRSLSSQGAMGTQAHHHSSPSTRSRPRTNVPSQQSPHTPNPQQHQQYHATPALVGASTISPSATGNGPVQPPPHLAQGPPPPHPPPMIPYYPHPSMYYGAPGDVMGMQYPPLGHLHGPPPDPSQGHHPTRQLYPHGNTNPPVVHHYPLGQPSHTRQPYPPIHAPTSVPLPTLGPHQSLHEPPGLASNIHIPPAERVSSQESSPQQAGPVSSPSAADGGGVAAATTSSPPSATPSPAAEATRASSSPTSQATSHNPIHGQHPEHPHRSSEHPSTSSSSHKENDAWDHEQDRSEASTSPKDGQHDHGEQPSLSLPAAGKMSHSALPAMGVGGGVPAVPAYGYPIPFYGAAVPPIYNTAGPRGQMGYPVPTGQVPPMLPGRPINPPPPPQVQSHNYKHAYMGGGGGGAGGGGGGGSSGGSGGGGSGGGGGAYPPEYGGHYMPPEHWHAFPPQQSLQKKPKELDKAMWVGNVSSDTTVADLQAIFEEPPTEEEGDIQIDLPESIFILSKSNCAFVNYATHEAVHRAVKRFHDREFKNIRLVCRPRKDPGGNDSYGTRHSSSSRYPSQPQHPTSRPVPTVGSGIPTGPVDSTHDVQSYPTVQQQSGQHELDEKEHPGQGTPSTDTTSMNMDALRQELSPAPDSVSSGGGPGGGGGGGSVTPRDRDSRPRHSRPGKPLKHLSDLKGRSRSSSAHHAENRYFILKGLNEEDLKLSVQYSLWATQDHLVPVLNQAFANSTNVYLIFSANKSGEFFGFARMMDSISQEKHDHIFKTRSEANWIPSIAIPLSPELKSEVTRYIEEAEAEGRSISYEEAEIIANESTPTKTWGIVFPVQWLFVHKVPFTATSHLSNPYYDNRDVKLSKDGTEVEPTVGEQLLAELRKHRELKKSGSSASGTSTPLGSESGLENSRRSSVGGGGDKKEPAAASPKPEITDIRRSSSQSNKSAESVPNSGGVQSSEAPLQAALVAKSPLMQAGSQQGSQGQSQQQQQQIPQSGATITPVSPGHPLPTSQPSARKQGSSFYGQNTGSGHPRNHYSGSTHAGQRAGPSGGYRSQGQMSYGPGPYGGSHQGYGPHGQWQGKIGSRGNQEYHSLGPSGHLPAQNQDHQSSSSTFSPPPQQQPYYNPRRNQNSSRYYQQHQGSSGPYGPPDGSYPSQYLPHPPGGANYEYSASPGGQYYSQPYSRRRNQGPSAGYRHAADAHASGVHGGGYKHHGGQMTPGGPDSTGYAHPPGPGSPPHGGYRVMHPMMNSYPGMPPVMGYQFHHGQPFIPVPIAWHPTQGLPAQASTGEAATGPAGAGSGTKASGINSGNANQSSTAVNALGSSSVAPAGGMAMVMGPQGYPAYAPFPAMPTMAQGMSATGDVMMEGMVPTALGYDGIHYMYVPAEMADTYHQPMYYYGMPVPPGVEAPAVASPTSGDGTPATDIVGELDTAKPAGEEYESEQKGSPKAGALSQPGSSDDGEGGADSPVSQQDSSPPDTLAAGTKSGETAVRESSNGDSNGSNGNGTTASTAAAVPSSTTVPKKSRKAKKPNKGSATTTSTETFHAMKE